MRKWGIPAGRRVQGNGNGSGNNGGGGQQGGGAPVFTSSSSPTVAENATLSHTLTATTNPTFSIVGGADQAQFEISGSTLRWSSNGTRDYEAPADANTDNAYVVTVRATKNSRTTDQTITVTVTNVSDDPNFASVVLLCGFDGVDGAGSSTDDSSAHRTLTFNGNTQIDTAQSKFGGSSVLLDGSGDAVAASDSADWVFGTGQFTLECWVRFNTLPTGLNSGDKFMAQWETGATAWAFGRPDGSTSELNFICSTDGSTISTTVTTSGAGITTGTWYHVACDRDASNKVRIYVDGVMRGSATGVTDNIANVASEMCIGAESGPTRSRSLDGWIDEVRITKGVARYASDGGFTVPSAAFPRS